jgi:hypothetical protein
MRSDLVLLAEVAAVRAELKELCKRSEEKARFLIWVRC